MATPTTTLGRQPIITLSIVEWSYTRLTIQARVQRLHPEQSQSPEPGRIEFRGDAYWQWNNQPIRAHGKRICWAELLHDALEGWHACVLHTNSEVAILPHHPDYPRVKALVEYGGSYGA